MALFRWIADKLFGPPKRDISRLEDSDVELVEEAVDLSGGPLKPGHRRRALRDRRLLPKRKASGFSPLKRQAILDRATADRLFSKTQRTSNRNIRDLMADVEQLKLYDLPVWKTEADLAADLGLTLGELHHFSTHKFRERVCHYITFRLPKNKGGERLIMAPKRKLKAIQRKLLKQVLNKLPVPKQAHGFVRGRSVKSGAEAHVGKAVVVKMDLANFFGTVTYPRVRGFFIALGYSYSVATTLAVLCTECERQRVVLDQDIFHAPVGERHCVQGAPTSPAICNQIARRLDHRLQGLAKKLGFAYTRYADDLTFSGDEVDKVKSLLGLARKIILSEGFELRADKTKVLHQGGGQKVTGVTVNQVLGLSRKERRQIRALLHRLQNEQSPDPAELAHARGKIAYLRMLNPEQADALVKKFPLFHC